MSASSASNGAITPADDLYAKFTVAAAVFFLSLELGYFALADTMSFARPPLDPFGAAIGRDFLNTWMGGRAALSGGPTAWFDFATYNTALREIVGHPDFPDHFWSYPPHLLLFTWPLGLMPYLAAYAVWCLIGLVLYMLAARAGGIGRAQLLFLAVAPAVTVNVFFGQNGFITAALLVGGLAFMDRRPLFAGVLFGVLTIKPQLGLLLPLMLVLTGRWRVIISATVTAAALIALTSWLYGADIWAEYVRKVTPQQQWLLTDGGGLLVPMVSSAFVNARMVGLPLQAAWVVQGVASCAAVAIVVWTFWRRRDPVLSLALFVTATFLFTPWALNYDMVVFGWVVALLRERTDNEPFDHYLAIAVWTLPVTMLLLGAARIPVAMLVLPGFAARLLWRLARSEKHTPGGSPATGLGIAPGRP